jgi:molybdenum cofactor biosynthesis enzyme MoaA
LCSEIGAIPGLKTLAMTTNGLVLKRMLPSLREARVSHLNISLDTLIPEKFDKITRRSGLQRVLDAIHSALELGFDPVKVVWCSQLMWAVMVRL